MGYFAAATIAYLAFTFYVSLKVKKAEYKDLERKKIHQVFIWLLPFMAPLLIKSYWLTRKKVKLVANTKGNRKSKEGGFYESGIGMSGGDDE
jgi:hypothetical protein